MDGVLGKAVLQPLPVTQVGGILGKAVFHPLPVTPAGGKTHNAKAMLAAIPASRQACLLCASFTASLTTSLK